MEKHDKIVCVVCGGAGLVGGCTSCGTIQYNEDIVDIKSAESIIDIPLYYKDKPWDIIKARKDDDTESCALTLNTLNKLVMTSSSGSLPQSSYMFLLPENHGKRYALYSMMQNYITRGISVAPVVDILSFNLMSSRNRYEDQELLFKYLQSDITFVYNTDFITRKLTSKIFRNLASTRALSDKPTIFLGSYSYKELSSWDNKSDIGYKANIVESDKKAEPYILDGIVRRV